MSYKYVKSDKGVESMFEDTNLPYTLLKLTYNEYTVCQKRYTKFENELLELFDPFYRVTIDNYNNKLILQIKRRKEHVEPSSTAAMRLHTWTDDEESQLYYLTIENGQALNINDIRSVLGILPSSLCLGSPRVDLTYLAADGPLQVYLQKPLDVEFGTTVQVDRFNVVREVNGLRGFVRSE